VSRAQRLALVAPSTEDGGVERYIRMVARAATRREWTLHVGLPGVEGIDRFRDDLSEAGAQCHVLDVGLRQPRGKLEALASVVTDAVGTARFLRKVGCRSVMVVLPHPDRTPGAVLAAALSRSRSVASVHLVPPDLSFSGGRRLLYTLARRSGMQWTAVSADNRRRMARALGWNERTVALVHNGVEVVQRVTVAEREQARLQIRESLELPDTAKLLLSVGRLNQQKGHDLIIDSIPRVLSAHDDVWWVWAGDGPRREELARQLQLTGLSARVKMLGARSDVRRLLASADLFLFPSRYEGLAFAVLEAHLSALPVIASNAGSMPEIVRDRVDGRLVRSDDPQALAATTSWALANMDQMRTFAEAGRRRVIAEFSADRMTDATLQLLLEPVNDISMPERRRD
jgi:glycosyltransferase involved in cell wall biosynthesis